MIITAKTQATVTTTGVVVEFSCAEAAWLCYQILGKLPYEGDTTEKYRLYTALKSLVTPDGRAR